MPDYPQDRPGTQALARIALPTADVQRILTLLDDGLPRRCYRIEDELGLHDRRVYETLVALADHGHVTLEVRPNGEVFRRPKAPHDSAPKPEPISAVLPAAPPSTLAAPAPGPASSAPPAPLAFGDVPAPLRGATFLRLTGRGGIPQPPREPPERGPNWITGDRTDLRRWLAGGGNVGLLLADLVVIDVDPKHAVSKLGSIDRDMAITVADDLVRQHLRPRGLPRTLCQRSRSGGLHFLYRAAPHRRYHEIPIPELMGPGGPLIETRSGPHRWIILAPSKFSAPLAPVTWREWTVLADAPDWLPWDRPPRPGAPVERQVGPVEQRVLTRLPFPELLEREGWSSTPHREGYTLWTRPGKGREDGPSATLDKAGPGVLHVFSTAAPVPPGNYNAFEYLSERYYGGDTYAALALLEPR